MCDARLLDGSRVNVAIKPIAVDGPLVSIRKFSKRPYSMDKLVEINSICHEMAAVLVAAVAGRVTVLVSGGTGSGKTTMLNEQADAARIELRHGHYGLPIRQARDTECVGHGRASVGISVRQRYKLDACQRLVAQRMATSHQPCITATRIGRSGEAFRLLPDPTCESRMISPSRMTRLGLARVSCLTSGLS